MYIEGVAGAFIARSKSTYWRIAWLAFNRETHAESKAVHGVCPFEKDAVRLRFCPRADFLLYSEELQMQLDFGFFITNMLLGAGLAMDAFSVSVVNGLNEPCMRRKKMLLIAGIFALFQFAMPAIGWLCVSTIADLFDAFSKFIPWIAFALLAYIGGKMLRDGIHNKEECECCKCAVAFSAAADTAKTYNFHIVYLSCFVFLPLEPIVCERVISESLR